MPHTPQPSLIQEAEVLGPPGSSLVDALKFRLAAQIAPRKWQPPILGIAQALEQGQPLAEAIAAQRVPRELDCLLQVSVKCSAPGKLLLDTLRIRVDIRQHWYRFVGVCLYPLVLLLFAIAIGVLFSYCMRLMIDFQWVDDFGLAGVEALRARIIDQHHATMGMGIIAAWLILAMATIYIAGPPWAWLSVIGGLIAFGKPMRWLSLQEMLLRLKIFMNLEPSPVEATAALSRSLAYSQQSMVARRIATRVEQGVPLGKALGDSMLSDGICRPGLYLLDDRGADMQAALGETSELLARLTQRRLRTLASILPFVSLGFVGLIIWAAINSYLSILQPLIRMISSLA